MHLHEDRANWSNRPKFSIIIPLYNKKDFIGITLESVLTQTIDDYEIIIIDDGSIDGGDEYVSRVFDDNRISIYRQANGGVSSARNLGISVSVGDILCFLDADDYWLPNKLEAINNLFLEFPAVLFSATSYFEFAELRPDSVSLENASYVAKLSVVDEFYSKWRRYPFVFTSSIAVRRAALIDNNIYFPIGENLGEDQDVWFRLSEISPLAYSSAKLVGYRRGISNSLASTDPVDILPAYQRLKKRHEAFQSNNDTSKNAMKLYRKHSCDVALINARRGLRKRSIKFLEPSCLVWPKFVITYVLDLIDPRIVEIAKNFWKNRFYLFKCQSY